MRLNGLGIGFLSGTNPTEAQLAAIKRLCALVNGYNLQACAADSFGNVPQYRRALQFKEALLSFMIKEHSNLPAGSGAPPNVNGKSIQTILSENLNGSQDNQDELCADYYALWQFFRLICTAVTAGLGIYGTIKNGQALLDQTQSDLQQFGSLASTTINELQHGTATAGSKAKPVQTYVDAATNVYSAIQTYGAARAAINNYFSSITHPSTGSPGDGGQVTTGGGYRTCPDGSHVAPHQRCPPKPKPVKPPRNPGIPPSVPVYQGPPSTPNNCPDGTPYSDGSPCVYVCSNGFKVYYNPYTQPNPSGVCPINTFVPPTPQGPPYVGGQPVSGPTCSNGTPAAAYPGGQCPPSGMPTYPGTITTAPQGPTPPPQAPSWVRCPNGTAADTLAHCSGTIQQPSYPGTPINPPAPPPSPPTETYRCDNGCTIPINSHCAKQCPGNPAWVPTCQSCGIVLTPTQGGDTSGPVNWPTGPGVPPGGFPPLPPPGGGGPIFVDPGEPSYGTAGLGRLRDYHTLRGLSGASPWPVAPASIKGCSWPKTGPNPCSPKYATLPQIMSIGAARNVLAQAKTWLTKLTALGKAITASWGQSVASSLGLSPGQIAAEAKSMQQFIRIGVMPPEFVVGSPFYGPNAYLRAYMTLPSPQYLQNAVYSIVGYAALGEAIEVGDTNNLDDAVFQFVSSGRSSDSLLGAMYQILTNAISAPAPAVAAAPQPPTWPTQNLVPPNTTTLPIEAAGMIPPMSQTPTPPLGTTVTVTPAAGGVASRSTRRRMSGLRDASSAPDLRPLYMIAGAALFAWYGFKKK